ncbi:MAG: hypothetical protein K6D54_08995 [Bacteroidales bacterium]|nr:hypothetical protein [Bacteroidales bacterium]
MKKVFYAVMALAAILVSCSKEVDYIDEEIPGTGKLVTLHANVEQQTKVSADNAGAYSWQVDDVISVLNNSGEATNFTTTSAGTSVDFSGSFASGTLGNFAMYPACDDHTASDNAVTFSLPATLTWSANATNMPMLGKIESDNVSFKAVGGVLKLVCYNIPEGAAHFKFEATNKQIVGDFAIADGTVSEPTIVTAAKEGSNSVLDIEFTRSANMVFYIPLPTGTIDGFTVKILNDSDGELFSKTTTANLVVGRNKLILGPALNCATARVLVSEDFSSYSADDVPSGVVNGVTYSCTNGGGTTKIYDATLAGGESPELLIGKNSGSFTISGINCDGVSSMTLTFKKNGNALTVTATDGITVDGSTSGAGTKTISLTNTSLSSFDLTFTAGSSNVRFDDVLLIEAASASYTAPSIAPENEALIIAVGSTESSTAFTYSNRVDDMPVVAVVDDAAKAWLSAAIDGTTLTVTASGAYNGAADRIGTVTLRASGVNKQISVTQKTTLVPNPTVTATPGNEKFSASWTGDEHATSYVAYLRTTEGTPTDGTNISGNISVDAGVYSITNYAVANGTYYLYVKVSGVADGYEAPEDYVMRSFTCEGTPKGTDPANPYTVTEALSIISEYGDNAGGDSNVYTRGIVVAQGSLYNSTMITYDISVDGLAENTLRVFRGKNVSDTDFSAVTDLEAGDEVIVYGTLYKYKSGSNPAVAEINSGNYLYSLTKVHKMVIAPDADATMGGDANSVYTLTVTANYAWTASLNSEASSARGTNFDVLNSSDEVIDGSIAGSAGTTTIKFKAKGDGNGDGSTVTNYGTITFSDGIASSVKNIKQNPKASGGTYYVKVTDVTTLSAGDVVLIINTSSQGALPAFTSTGTISPTSLSSYYDSVNDRFPSDEDNVNACAITLVTPTTALDGKVVFKLKMSNNYFLVKTSTSGTGFNPADSSDAVSGDWTLTMDGNSRVQVQHNLVNATRGLIWRSGSTNKFGAYATSNVNNTEYYNVYFYKLTNL